MSTWPHCVDMLRNESPVNFYYNDAVNLAMLTTSLEPVGVALNQPGRRVRICVPHSAQNSRVTARSRSLRINCFGVPLV